MNTLIRKVTSRKFLVSVAGLIVGIAMALGAEASDIQTVAGAVTALVSVVTYVTTEGKVDAAGVKNAVESVQEAAETIEKQDN